MPKWKSVLTIVSAMVFCSGLIPNVSAHDGEPNPPFDPTKVQITDDLPCFSKSLANPYGHPGYNPKLCGGLLSPKIATHTTGVHGGLIWKKDSEIPKYLLWFRHPEFRAEDVVSSEVLERLIDGDLPLPLGVTDAPRNPLTGRNEGAFRDPRSNFQGAVRQSYAWGMYGGFSIVGHGRSVARRIHLDRGIEDVQMWDLSHPLAFASEGKYDVAKMTEAGAHLNKSAFKDSGFSKGLRYNIYCPGQAKLADGRVVFVGGNNMNSNNGQYKVNIFDPETETWAPRATPCHRAAWAAAPHDDPFFEHLFAPLYEAFFDDPTNAAKKAALYFLPNCNPVTGGARATVTMEMGFPFIRYEGPTVTSPPDRSDMRYARWYPTALTLPNNKVLVLSGVDQNESLGTTKPTKIDPATGRKVLDLDPVSGYTKDALTDGPFRDSVIFQVVPEIYDPEADRTRALENARLISPVYPHAFPIQTGPGRDDWKVVVFPGSLLSSLGGDQGFGGFHDGKTWLFDVRAALADPKRGTPGEKHLTFVDSLGADNRMGTAELLEIDKKGKLLSHKIISFGGQIPDPANPDAVIATDQVKMIDFAEPNPHWKSQQPIYQAATNSKSTPLPDGTVIIGAGQANSNPALEKRANLHFQLHNPADGTTKKLRVKSTVPRSSHGNIHLLPDATVMLVGDDHTNSVPVGDRVAPFGDADLGVDTAEIYYPAYLFNNDGSLAARPVIEEAPDEVKYGKDFHIEVEKGTRIKTVALIRTGLPTHSQSANIRYIKLAFEQDARKGELTVHAPVVPAQAIPGDYMLFVVDKNGVPSMAKHVRVPVMRNDDERHEDENHEHDRHEDERRAKR